jgi:glycosyltransferase involved in cell wall biosynthesis
VEPGGGDVRIALYHNHPSGGAARAMYELGKQLAIRHTVDVYTLSTADERFLSSGDYASQVRVTPFEPRKRVRMGFYLNDWRDYRNLQTLDALCQRIAGEIDEGQYDCVLVSACQFEEAPSVVNYLASRSAYYCHEPLRRFIDRECRVDAGPLTPYQRLRSLWHRPAQAALEGVLGRRDRRNVRAADAVLTNSAYTARTIESYYGRAADVCYLGVDAERFHPGSDDAGYMLSVGAIEYHKGFDFIIRALGMLPPSERPRLVIAGNGSNPGVARYLETLAGNRGVNLTLRAGDPPNSPALLRLYQEATAFVYASHSEPFGLVVLEAMACGRPVVAVGEGGVVESVVDGVTGVLTPRDEEQFAGALAQVLSGHAQRDAMGRAGREAVTEHWTWREAGLRLEATLAQGAPAGVAG